MPSTSPAASAHADEFALIERLRSGDEQTFETLVDRLHGTMLSVARGYVKTTADAQEVVQEAWLGVLNGLDRFEGRSSLKTWILRIVANTAMTRGKREARSMPFSSLMPEGEETAVDPQRFRGSEDAFPGHWNGYPADWRSLPEEALLGREAISVIQTAIEGLPEAQKTVITLRDIHGVQRRRGMRGARRLCRQSTRSPASRALRRARRSRESARWLSPPSTSPAKR